MQRVFALTFWLALAFTIVEALRPAYRSLHLFAWDKLDHAIAFAVLTLCAALAYPRWNMLRLGVALSALGACIELAQGTALIGRDGDVRDWMADTIAIAVVLSVAAVARWFMRQRA